MIMDEPSPINFILPLLRGPVYPDLFLAHPRFLREEHRFEKSQEREGLAQRPQKTRDGQGICSFPIHRGYRLVLKAFWGWLRGFGMRKESGEGKFIPFPHGPQEKAGIRPERRSPRLENGKGGRVNPPQREIDPGHPPGRSPGLVWQYNRPFPLPAISPGPCRQAGGSFPRWGYADPFSAPSGG
jgi:hypothetical protein